MNNTMLRWLLGSSPWQWTISRRCRTRMSSYSICSEWTGTPKKSRKQLQQIEIERMVLIEIIIIIIFQNIDYNYEIIAIIIIITIIIVITIIIYIIYIWFAHPSPPKNPELKHHRDGIPARWTCWITATWGSGDLWRRDACDACHQLYILMTLRTYTYKYVYIYTYINTWCTCIWRYIYIYTQYIYIHMPTGFCTHLYNVYMYNPIYIYIFEMYLTLLCINIIPGWFMGSHLYSPQRFGMSRDSKNL